MRKRYPTVAPLVLVLAILVAGISPSPVAQSPADAPTPEVELYTVQPGDTFFKIAERFYDTADKRQGAHWMNIYEASVDRGLINPLERPIELGPYGLSVMLEPGDTLAIPRYAQVYPSTDEIREEYPVVVLDETGETPVVPDPRTITVLHVDSAANRFALGLGSGVGLDDIATVARAARQDGSALLMDAGSAESHEVENQSRYNRAIEAVGFDVRVATPADRNAGSGMIILDRPSPGVENPVESRNLAGHALVEIGETLVGVIAIPDFGPSPDPWNLYEAATDELLRLEARGAEVLIAVTPYPVRELYAAGFFSNDALYRATPFLDRVDLIVDGSAEPGTVALDDTTRVVSAGAGDRVGRVDITVQQDRTIAVRTTSYDEARLAQMGESAPPELLHELRRIAAAEGLPTGDPRRITIVHSDNLHSRLAAGLTRGFGLDDIAAAVHAARDRRPTLFVDAGQTRSLPAEILANDAFIAASNKALEIVTPDVAIPGFTHPSHDGAPGASVDSQLRYVGEVAVGIITVPAGGEISRDYARATFSAAVRELETLESNGAEAIVVVTEHPLQDMLEESILTTADLAAAAPYADRVDLIIDGSASSAPLSLTDNTTVVSAGSLDRIGGVDITVTGTAVTDITPFSIDRELLLARGATVPDAVGRELWSLSGDLGIEERVTVLHSANLQNRIGLLTSPFGIDRIAAVTDVARRRAPTIVIDTGQTAVAPAELLPTEAGAIELIELLSDLGYGALVPGPGDLEYGTAAASLVATHGDLRLVSANLAASTDALARTAVLPAGPARIGILGVTETPTVDIDRLAAAVEDGLATLAAADTDAVVMVTQYPVADLFQNGFFSNADLRWAERYRDQVDVIIDGSGRTTSLVLDESTVVMPASGLAAMGGIDLFISGSGVTRIATERLTAARLAEAGIEPNATIRSRARAVAVGLGLPVPETAEPAIATTDDATGDAADTGGVTPGTPGTGATTFDPMAPETGPRFRLVAAPGMSMYNDTEGYGGTVGIATSMGEILGSDSALAPLTIGVSAVYDGALINDPNYTLHNGGLALSAGWEFNVGQLAGSEGVLSWFLITPELSLGALYQEKQHFGRVGYRGIAYYAAPAVRFEIAVPFLSALRIGASAGVNVMYGDSVIINARVAPSVSWAF